MKGAKIAYIDYITVTYPSRDSFRFDKYDGLEDFAHAIDYYFLSQFGLSFNPEMKGGRNGYKNHWKITAPVYGNKKQSADVGFFAFGGNNETICVSFTGQACQFIGSEGFSFIREFIEALKERITRIDLAHDCFNWELDLSTVRAWYDAGLFKANIRGKYPSCQFIDDYGSGKGCTFYIGSRESGKYFRAYE